MQKVLFWCALELLEGVSHVEVFVWREPPQAFCAR